MGQTPGGLLFILDPSDFSPELWRVSLYRKRRPCRFSFSRRYSFLAPIPSASCSIHLSPKPSSPVCFPSLRFRLYFNPTGWISLPRPVYRPSQAVFSIPDFSPSSGDMRESPILAPVFLPFPGPPIGLPARLYVTGSSRVCFLPSVPLFSFRPLVLGSPQQWRYASRTDGSALQDCRT